MSATNDVVKPSEVGWFAAKQPGLLRFLEDRLGHNHDALALGVELCWRVVAAFECQGGRSLARLHTSEIERAEEAVVAESRGDLHPLASSAHRQPELCQWLESMLKTPVLPLDRLELEQVALSCASVIFACDRAHSVAMPGAQGTVQDEELLQ